MPGQSGMSLKSRLKGWHCSKGVNAIASKTLLAWFCISELFVGTEGRLSVVELIMPQKKMGRVDGRYYPPHLSLRAERATFTALGSR